MNGPLSLELCDPWRCYAVPLDEVIRWGLYIFGGLGIWAGLTGAFGAWLAIRFLFKGAVVK